MDLIRFRSISPASTSSPCLWPYGNVIRKCVFARPDLVMGTVLDPCPSGWQDLSKSAVFVRSTRVRSLFFHHFSYIYSILIYQYLSNFFSQFGSNFKFRFPVGGFISFIFFYFERSIFCQNIYSYWELIIELIHTLIVEFINQRMLHNFILIK